MGLEKLIPWGISIIASTQPALTILLYWGGKEHVRNWWALTLSFDFEPFGVLISQRPESLSSSCHGVCPSSFPPMGTDGYEVTSMPSSVLGIKIDD